MRLFRLYSGDDQQGHKLLAKAAYPRRVRGIAAILPKCSAVSILVPIGCASPSGNSPKGETFGGLPDRGERSLADEPNGIIGTRQDRPDGRQKGEVCPMKGQLLENTLLFTREKWWSELNSNSRATNELYLPSSLKAMVRPSPARVNPAPSAERRRRSVIPSPGNRKAELIALSAVGTALSPATAYSPSQCSIGILHHSIIVSINGEGFWLKDKRKAGHCSASRVSDLRSVPVVPSPIFNTGSSSLGFQSRCQFGPRRDSIVAINFRARPRCREQPDRETDGGPNGCGGNTK